MYIQAQIFESRLSILILYQFGPFKDDRDTGTDKARQFTNRTTACQIQTPIEL